MAAEIDMKSVVKRLDVIIQLMLDNAGNGSESMKGKIERLLAFGLQQTEVAQIVGKPLNYITAVKSGKKKTNVQQEG